MWLMRQAGRYLAEYREVERRPDRSSISATIPTLAAEVTIQPIRRFGFDAAIIFSDILVVPHALGQHVEFLEGEGPHLEPIKDRGGSFQAFGFQGAVNLRDRLRSDRQGHGRPRGQDAADRVLRRALDGRELHGGRRRLPGLQGARSFWPIASRKPSARFSTCSSKLPPPI